MLHCVGIRYWVYEYALGLCYRAQEFGNSIPMVYEYTTMCMNMAQVCTIVHNLHYRA